MSLSLLKSHTHTLYKQASLNTSYTDQPEPALNKENILFGKCQTEKIENFIMQSVSMMFEVCRVPILHASRTMWRICIECDTRPQSWITSNLLKSWWAGDGARRDSSEGFITPDKIRRPSACEKLKESSPRVFTASSASSSRKLNNQSNL